MLDCHLTLVRCLLAFPTYPGFFTLHPVFLPGPKYLHLSSIYLLCLFPSTVLPYPGLQTLLLCMTALSFVQLFATPWTAVFQASLSFPFSQSLLKFMSIELVMPSNHLIFCYPLLLLLQTHHPNFFTSLVSPTYDYCYSKYLFIFWWKGREWFTVVPSNNSTLNSKTLAP